VIARLIETPQTDARLSRAGSQVAGPRGAEAPLFGTANSPVEDGDPAIRSAFASISTDELVGELARRGRPVLSGSATVPVGLVLEDVERARRAIGTSDRPDFAVGETVEALALPSPDEAQRYVDEATDAGEVSWAALLTRELVEALAADPRSRRERLVGLAAMAARWSEALDARGEGR